MEWAIEKARYGGSGACRKHDSKRACAGTCVSPGSERKSARGGFDGRGETGRPARAKDGRGRAQAAPMHDVASSAAGRGAENTRGTRWDTRGGGHSTPVAFSSDSWRLA